MKCRKCDIDLAEGALFCPACGERVAQTPPALTDAEVQASRDAVRVLTDRAHELRPEAIQTLVADAQVPLRAEIAELRTSLEEAQVAAQRLATVGEGGPGEERTHGFRDMGEFIQTAVLNRADPRLRPAIATPVGQTRDLSMGVGAAGGFLIPPQFGEMITAITPQDAIVRPRATVFPSGDFPDAPLTLPMLNQSGALGVFAGMTGAWVAEGGLKTETQPTVAQLTLTPHEVAAFVDVTDQMLRNNPAAITTLLQTGFRDVILSLEDIAFITGNGVGRPLGFLGHASNVNVVRAGGLGVAAIVYADVVAMLWRMLRLGTAGPVWLAHPSTLPQLQAMASVLGQLIWQPSAREGMPSTLLGYPVILNERQPVLGQIGDLMFVNLRYYAVKEGVGLSIRDDGGIGQFANNITRIKAFRSVDGQPMLATPLLAEDGVTTFSPFVVLN